MKFYVVSYPNDLGDFTRGEFPYVELLKDNWDDFGYKTFFTSYIFLNSNTRVELGAVKILHITSFTSFNKMPYEFDELEKDIFCSLGQTMEYYRRILKLGNDIYEEYLKAIKDIAIYKQYYKAFENHEGIRESFFRSSEPRKVFKSADQFFGGVRKDEIFKFNYSFKPPYSLIDQKVDFLFDYTLYDFLPHRMHVLVGKNGSGKTQFMAQFANALCGDESKENSINAFDTMPLFSKVIAVSFSAFDEFSKPHQTRNFNIDGEEAKKLNNYIYCGIQGKDKKTISMEEMKENAKNTLYELQEDSEKFAAWKRILENVFEDEFRTFVIEEEPEQLFERKLSSGQSILLYTMTNVISSIEYESILLFDEPELHLHPNAISNLMRMLNELLNEFNSYAIVSTHSSLIVQETPSRYIKKLDRNNNTLRVSELSLESFGENLTEITEEVFNVRDLESNYMTLLRDVVTLQNKKFEQILQSFPKGLSYNAMTYLNVLELNKDGKR